MLSQFLSQFFVVKYLKPLLVLLILPFCLSANVILADIVAGREEGESGDIGELNEQSPPKPPQSEKFKRKFTQDYLLLLNPMGGTFKSRVNLSGIDAPTQGNIRDVSGGGGIFGLFSTPHVDFSNLFFRTDIDGSYGLDLRKITGNPLAPIIPITESYDVIGNLSYINAYLNKDDCVTPNLGVGYFYHKIKGQYTTVTVNEPMLKLGLRFNLKGLRLVWNPYVSYSWDRSDVAIRNGATAVDTSSSNDSLIYGTALKWRWRMIQSEIKYSYKDSLVGKKGLNSLNLQTGVFFNEWAGFSANFNYKDGIVCKEKSFMAGPIFAF